MRYGLPWCWTRNSFMLVCRESRTVSTCGRPRDGPTSFEQVHRKVDAFVLIVIESAIPLGKFVADFDRPGHGTKYTLHGIYCQGYIGRRANRVATAAPRVSEKDRI